MSPQAMAAQAGELVLELLDQQIAVLEFGLVDRETCIPPRHLRAQPLDLAVR